MRGGSGSKKNKVFDSNMFRVLSFFIVLHQDSETTFCFIVDHIQYEHLKGSVIAHLIFADIVSNVSNPRRWKQHQDLTQGMPPCVFSQSNCS